MARGERDGGERGQAAVELALVLPLLVLLLLAIVQVTLVARDQILVVHAARAGAREAAVSETPAQAPAAARRAVLEAGGLKSERTMTDMTRVGGSDTVIVRVRFTAPTDVPLVGPLLPDVPLEGRAIMRVER
jgi:Flp pilus assembly protein TadG